MKTQLQIRMQSTDKVAINGAQKPSRIDIYMERQTAGKRDRAKERLPDTKIDCDDHVRKCGAGCWRHLTGSK